MRTVLIAALLAGCVERAPSLTLAAEDATRLDGPGQTAFRLGTLDHLMIRFQTRDLPKGVSWVTLRLYMPDGTLYDRRHLAFSNDVAFTRVASPDGVPHPIDVLPARRTASGFALDTSILVGGTNLERHPVRGRWKISCALDAQPETRAETIVDLE